MKRHDLDVEGRGVHATSLAVWGPSSPAVAGKSFRVRVGVKCAVGCPLSGSTVRVHDEAGTTVRESTLGATPWPGTRGLYVAELELPSPALEGVSRWSAVFGAEASRPHGSSAFPFSVRTVLPPEHAVAVRVTGDESEAPLEGAVVFMEAYRATTDARGVARFSVPKGTYSLALRKPGCECAPVTVEVTRDETVALEARLLPDVDPDEEEAWM